MASIDVEGVKEHVLLAPSLLVATLREGNEDVITISLETMITKDLKNKGTYLRTVNNPMNIDVEENEEQSLLRVKSMLGEKLG